MIQKGIIESIVSAYEYKVRIPRYDKLVTTPGAVPTDNLSSAIVCSIPSTKVSFAIGDIVLIGFENDELTKPVILGLLYRQGTTDSEQFSIPYIQTLIKELEDDLSILRDNNLYTHIKYSNDNGLTFTSLYDYTEVNTVTTSQNTYKSASNISIDPNSNVIYWSVINSKGVDITSTMNITTTLYVEDDTSLVESFTDTLIKIPLKFKGLNNLKLSFRILQVSEYDDYHIVLTTDKNTIGSVYGDYLGVCISTDPIPPLTPTSYSWSSFYKLMNNLVNELENSLLPRIERNEKALYGYTYSTDIRNTDSTGLLDGIRVEKDAIYIHGLENKNIYLNSNTTMYIDNGNDNFTLRDLEYTNVSADSIFSDSYTEQGHLVLSRRKRAH